MSETAVIVIILVVGLLAGGFMFYAGLRTGSSMTWRSMKGLNPTSKPVSKKELQKITKQLNTDLDGELKEDEERFNI